MMGVEKQTIAPLNRKEFSYLTGIDNPYGSRIVITTETEIPYTYIMKSEICDNLYKFGRTKNLKERFKTLNSSAKFRKFQFTPFAYIPCDKEQLILLSLFHSNATPLYLNAKETKFPEAYYLNEDDLSYIIDLYHFHRVDRDNAPEAISLITTKYRNVFGWITKVEHSVML